MKAFVVQEYGSPDGLQLAEVDRPSPRPNEVRIKIHATTVTAGDVILRKLKFPMRLVMGVFMGLGKNKILGHELAGVVDAVGPKVTRYQVGDPIFATTGMRGGANAEFICMPEDGLLAPKPANMTFSEAAAVPVGGITALYILRRGNIQVGQKVLVYGASGSVGTYAVQLARHWGAQVTGVCSTPNLAWVSALGADRVMDYTQEDFRENGQHYDLIFDAVGKISSDQTNNSLKSEGTYLSVKSSIKEKSEDLSYLKGLIEAGDLKAVIDRCYPLNKLPEAHRYVDKGHKRGNVVITVVEDQELTQGASLNPSDYPA